jgi:hypothetical protein
MSEPPAPEASADPHQDAVHLEGVLPLDWSDGIEPALADVMADNAILLRALLILDESAAPAPTESRDAVQNLERRVDLLLLLANSALRSVTRMPPARPCVLSARHLRWGSETALGVGRRVWVRIYLRHRIALPLILPGQIVEEEVQGELLWHRLELEPLEQALQDDLERLVFRHHRRQVARQRAAV